MGGSVEWPSDLSALKRSVAEAVWSQLCPPIETFQRADILLPCLFENQRRSGEDEGRVRAERAAGGPLQLGAADHRNGPEHGPPEGGARQIWGYCNAIYLLIPKKCDKSECVCERWHLFLFLFFFFFASQTWLSEAVGGEESSNALNNNTQHA